MLNSSFKLIQCENPSQTLKIHVLFVLVSVYGLVKSSYKPHLTSTMLQQSPHGLSAVVLSRLVLHFSVCLFTPSSLYLLVYLSSFSLPRYRSPLFSRFLCPHPPTSPTLSPSFCIYCCIYFC